MLQRKAARLCSTAETWPFRASGTTPFRTQGVKALGCRAQEFMASGLRELKLIESFSGDVAERAPVVGARVAEEISMRLG